MGSSRTFVTDIELCRPLAVIEGLEGYRSVRALVRLAGAPLGEVELPVVGGGCSPAALREAVVSSLSWPLAVRFVEAGLAAPAGPVAPTELPLAALAEPGPAQLPVTVAVCTRDRPEDLARCLDALDRLDEPGLEVLVVDNAPVDDATRRVVAAHPRARYVREDRPGLDWARNRALLEAKGDVVAFTDDDTAADRLWVRALAARFATDPGVMAVTGLVVPLELETEAQQLFERQGGFGRGFIRRWTTGRTDRPIGRDHGGTGMFGTGANMAFRRAVFAEIGMFDPALDVGTPTQGGGDLEMFFRILKAGHTLAYEPGAVVRHRHRRTGEALVRQLAGNGFGVVSSWRRMAQANPEERGPLTRLGAIWLVRWYLRRLVVASIRPGAVSPSLVLAELFPYLRARPRLARSRMQERDTLRRFGPQPPLLIDPPVGRRPDPDAIAVWHLDLADLPDLLHAPAHFRSRAFLSIRGEPVGLVDLDHGGAPVSADRVRSEAAWRYTDELATAMNGGRALPEGWKEHLAEARVPPVPVEAPMRLDPGIAVSIVVATLDRPDDLRTCLTRLQLLDTDRPVELVVVDNNPASGLTPPVVADFDGVTLVEEPRRGLAYARNAGFLAATGAVHVATDDDVLVEPGWLERLVAPFARADVGAVAGNVLPVSLDLGPERMFEAYGGLGRGSLRRIYDRTWFEQARSAVPTWTIGATANAAFRAEVFDDPAIGLMEESLGPGMPSGVGEDTYLFYAILRAGWSIAYEPAAVVHHRHRRTMTDLRRQLYAYSTGHVAYHLTTLVKDRDLRAGRHLVYDLPKWHLRQAARMLIGRNDQPLELLRLQVGGNIVGPWKLVQSRRRVRSEGRSR